MSKVMAGLLLSLPLAMPLTAQNPGQRIGVTVQINSVTVRGDTVGISSTVTNNADSREALRTFMVDEPAGVLAVRGDSNSTTRWWTGTDFKERPVARWALLGKKLVPGTTSPTLYFESIGLPGILAYWAQGDYELETGEDFPDSVLVVDVMAVHMVSGKTVGINRWPRDRSPARLLTRLRSLTLNACGTALNWITDRALCRQLLADLDQAQYDSSVGQTPQARSALLHFDRLLGSINGGKYATGVSSSAYWLLTVNADIIKRMLAVDGRQKTR